MTSRSTNLEALVADYKRDTRPCRATKLRWYASAPSLPDAINRAVLALGEDGKCEPHQRRVGRLKLQTYLEQVKKQTSVIRRVRRFQTLYDVLWNCRTERIGALTVYDTAIRLATHLGLRPEAVYVHAGALAGAKALGLPIVDGRVLRKDLPIEFRDLECDEVEDCLCIFREQLRGRQSRKAHCARNVTPRTIC